MFSMTSVLEVSLLRRSLGGFCPGQSTPVARMTGQGLAVDEGNELDQLFNSMEGDETWIEYWRPGLSVSTCNSRVIAVHATISVLYRGIELIGEPVGPQLLRWWDLDSWPYPDEEECDIIASQLHGVRFDLDTGGVSSVHLGSKGSFVGRAGAAARVLFGTYRRQGIIRLWD